MLEPVEIGKRGVEFKVWRKWKKKDKLSGTLVVSVGGLSWYPANAKIRKFRSWDDFAEAMESGD